MNSTKSEFTVLNSIKSQFTVLNSIKSEFTVLNSIKSGVYCSEKYKVESLLFYYTVGLHFKMIVGILELHSSNSEEDSKVLSPNKCNEYCFTLEINQLIENNKIHLS